MIQSVGFKTVVIDSEMMLCVGVSGMW